MWKPFGISLSFLIWLPYLITLVLVGMVIIIRLLRRNARAQEAAAAKLDDIAISLRTIAVSVDQSRRTNDTPPHG
jgi:hypothetical protein